MKNHHRFSRIVLRWGIILSACLLSTSNAKEPKTERPPLSDLEILTRGEPKAFFFRRSESLARGELKDDYQAWEETFLPLNGIMGKALDEEVPNTQEHNIPFFTRYKLAHPEKLVLLHFDPVARRPEYEGDRFYAGHWTYYNGTTTANAIPPSQGETSIRVKDTRVFSLEYGRPPKTDDIGICRIADDGRPDWSYAEQVDLLDIDHEKGTITVKRGCFGTTPKAFPDGAYLAAHRCDAHGRHPMQWNYNLAAGSPVDEQGRSCSDVLVEEFAEKFSPGGVLEHFDGIAFDIMMFNEFDSFWKNVNRNGRGADVNADGVADWGEVDGIEAWGIGMTRFSMRLRAVLGPDRIITGDGWTRDHQRSFGILNGIESEGWPTLWDGRCNGWSGGLNRHLFWHMHGAEPQFAYINHKHELRRSQREAGLSDVVPPNIDRLVMAAAMMTNAAVTYSNTPDNKGGHAVGIYDELIMGMDNQTNWLGQVDGPAWHLATSTPDLLNGAGKDWTTALKDRLRGPEVEFQLREGNEILQVSGSGAGQTSTWQLPDVEVPSHDLFIQIKLKCDPLGNYPEDVAGVMARWLNVRWIAENYKNPISPNDLMTWMNGEWFTATFYFRNVGPGSGVIEFEAEGTEAVYIDELSIYSSADAMVRLFEHGLVIANPSDRPYTFHLGKMFPGERFRRLMGNEYHQPDINNGREVNDTITVGPRDARFLVNLSPEAVSRPSTPAPGSATSKNSLPFYGSGRDAPHNPHASRVEGHAEKRIRERLDRGLTAVLVEENKVYLSWRLLEEDPEDASFDVHRILNGRDTGPINDTPVKRTSDFIDKLPGEKPGRLAYYVVMNGHRKPESRSQPVEVNLDQDWPGYRSIPLRGNYATSDVAVADLTGDGRHELIIRQPDIHVGPGYHVHRASETTNKLEAYSMGGECLWVHDMGWSVELGIHYAPFLAYDLDGDGKAEVVTRHIPGDYRDLTERTRESGGGRVRTGPEYLAVMDGLTGNIKARAPWPGREEWTPDLVEPEGARGAIPYQHYEARNQVGLAYLDGKTPCVVVARGCYHLIVVETYEYTSEGELRQLWHWDNRGLPYKYWGQGGHNLVCADLDEDSRDEVILGAMALDDDGSILWTTGLGHVDGTYVGDLNPVRPGLEVYLNVENRPYNLEQLNTMCMLDAATGELIWGYDQPSRHVHNPGLCSDIDASHPGAECYGAEKFDAHIQWLWSSDGRLLGKEDLDNTAPHAVYWDEDPQREIIRGTRTGYLNIRSPEHVYEDYKIRDYEGEVLSGEIVGHVLAVADLLGDWREEVITVLEGELRIYQSTIPAAFRNTCLLQDPFYRNSVANFSGGYTYGPTLRFDLATRIENRQLNAAK